MERKKRTKNISYILQIIDSARLSNLITKSCCKIIKSHHKILLITFLKKFIKFNVNTDMVIKNMKLAELNISIAIAFLNIQTLKMIG